MFSKDWIANGSTRFHVNGDAIEMDMPAVINNHIVRQRWNPNSDKTPEQRYVIAAICIEELQTEYWALMEEGENADIERLELIEVFIEQLRAWRHSNPVKGI